MTVHRDEIQSGKIRPQEGGSWSQGMPKMAFASAAFFLLQYFPILEYVSTSVEQAVQQPLVSRGGGVPARFGDGVGVTTNEVVSSGESVKHEVFPRGYVSS